MQVVQADRRRAGVADEPLERAADELRGQRRAVLAREHQSAVVPGLAPGCGLAALPLAVLAQTRVAVEASATTPWLSAFGVTCSVA